VSTSTLDFNAKGHKFQPEINLVIMNSLLLSNQYKTAKTRILILLRVPVFWLRETEFIRLSGIFKECMTVRWINRTLRSGPMSHASQVGVGRVYWTLSQLHLSFKKRAMELHCQNLRAVTIILVYAQSVVMQVSRLFPKHTNFYPPERIAYIKARQIGCFVECLKAKG
jgi:hypothetical protein